MRWTVPNILTTARLIAAPWVALVFVVMPRGAADWVALILFVVASLTDYVDGYLARSRGQITAYGTMLDPIADKAVVVIAIATLAALFGPTFWIIVPATVILLREVFVSGLREFLGAKSGLLKVSNLAKYKTFTQMLAVTILFMHGLYTHYLLNLAYGLGEEMYRDILDGVVEDRVGLIHVQMGSDFTLMIGIVLLWLAALLTVLTGWDYFRKARPYLQEPEGS